MNKLCCTGTHPPKKPVFPPFPRSGDLGTLRKLIQILGDSIGDSGTCWLSPRRSREISGTFRTDFEDVLGRFQGFFWADFGDIPEHISSVLKIMEIDDWTINHFSHSLFLYCIESKSVVKVVAQNMGFDLCFW
jgi:hypothetical protein